MNKSILLLEEDVEGREILSKMLRQRGFRVVAAENTSAAFAVLGSGDPVDVVLTGATYRNRLEFFADLRERLSSVPVVFLANHHAAELKPRQVQSGFCASPKLNLYINTRPIEFSELDRLIRTLPGSRSAAPGPDMHTA